MNTPRSPEQILHTFGRIESAGIKRPPAFDTGPKLKAAATAWVAILAPLMSAESFAAAVMAHLRDPEEGRFWPTPAHVIGQFNRVALAGIPTAATVFPKLLSRRGSWGPDHMERGLASLVTDGTPRPKLDAGIAALGGWAELGHVPDPKFGGDAVGYSIALRAFAAAYNAAPLTTALTVAQ